MGGVSKMLTFAYIVGGLVKANAYISKKKVKSHKMLIISGETYIFFPQSKMFETLNYKQNKYHFEDYSRVPNKHRLSNKHRLWKNWKK